MSWQKGDPLSKREISPGDPQNWWADWIAPRRPRTPAESLWLAVVAEAAWTATGDPTHPRLGPAVVQARRWFAALDDDTVGSCAWVCRELHVLGGPRRLRDSVHALIAAGQRPRYW